MTLSALVFGALVMLGRLEGIPRSALLIYWLLALFMVGGSRLVVRAWFQAAIKRRGTEKPVVIYGAGTGDWPGHQPVQWPAVPPGGLRG